MAIVLILGVLTVLLFRPTPFNMVALVFGGVVAAEVLGWLIRAFVTALEGRSRAMLVAAPLAIRWGIIAIAAVKLTIALEGLNHALAVLDSIRLPL